MGLMADLEARARGCKLCDRPIVLLKDVSTGKWVPVDLESVRSAVVVVDDKQSGGVRVVATPHWATCPHAEEFRKKKGNTEPAPEREPGEEG